MAKHEKAKLQPAGRCASWKSRAKFPELLCSKGMKREKEPRSGLQRNVTKNASHSDFNLLIGPFCEGGDLSEWICLLLQQFKAFQSGFIGRDSLPQETVIGGKY